MATLSAKPVVQAPAATEHPVRLQQGRAERGRPRVVRDGAVQAKPIRLVERWAGFQDGQYQYELGCADGGFFAVPRPLLSRTLEMSNHDGLPPGVARLAPMILQLATETDLPPPVSVRMQEIEVMVDEYRPDTNPPTLLFMQRPTCSDGDPGEGLLHYGVVLPSSRTAVRLAVPPQVQTAVTGRNRPLDIRLELTARNPGWYRYNVRLIYRFRQMEKVARFGPVLAYVPGRRDYEWYRRSYNQRARVLTAGQETRLVSELNKWSPHRWPPRLSDVSEQSRPVGRPD